MNRRVELIGAPLRRRHSAVMHNAAFEAFGIDATYELCELRREDLSSFVRQARGTEWLGFQITAPYKADVLGLLDLVEPDAASIGAVNSVVRRDDGSLLGFNTDSQGFASGVEERLDVAFAGARIVVAGAGGAARSVVHACLQRGAEQVTVGNRTASRAHALARELDPAGNRVVGTELSGGCFDRALHGATLAVNATTVGMIGPGVTFDVDRLPDGAAVCDLVYVPPETELLHRARRRGLRWCGGSAMLVAQAALAFARWTGVADAGPVMAEALAPLLADGPASP